MEEIEYLEEYEDLILPTIQTNTGSVGGFRARTMMQDEDSSSIDQDIFESLFDDHSDDESTILQKKADPKLSQRRADDRASLDSLDMLVKDLVGEQNSQKKTQNPNASNKKIPSSSIGARPGQRGRPQMRGAMGKVSLPPQKRSSLPSTSSEAAGGSSRPKPSFSNTTRPELSKYDKTKSVATVRPTMQQQKQLQIKRFQHTGIVSNRGRPALTRGGLQSAIGRKPTTITRGSLSRKPMRPPTTIVKPEKRETKDPSEDPLSLDDIAEALLDSDTDSFSLSDVSDESLDSLSDLEDSQNIIDISNDSSIDGKLNHKDLDNVRTDTPSPTVSEVDKDEESSSPQNKIKFNKLGIKEQDEVVKQSLMSLLGEDDEDNEPMNPEKKSADKVTIISDTLLNRIDNALLESNMIDNKRIEPNEFTNQSNEDVVAALERELMPFLKKKNSTDSREDGHTKTIGITITPANQQRSDSSNAPAIKGVKITSTALSEDVNITATTKDLAVSSSTDISENNSISNSNMINELSQAVFGIDSDAIEANLNELQQGTNPSIENEEIIEGPITTSNDQFVDGVDNIPEAMNDFHSHMEDAFLNEQVAMEVEVETIKDTEFEVAQRIEEFELGSNAEQPDESSISCNAECERDKNPDEILPATETKLSELGKDISCPDQDSNEDIVSKRLTRKRAAESPVLEHKSTKKEFKEPLNISTKDEPARSESLAVTKRSSRSPALSEKSREDSPQSVKKLKPETKRKTRRFRNLDDPTDTSETDLKVEKIATAIQENNVPLVEKSVDTEQVLDSNVAEKNSEEFNKPKKIKRLDNASRSTPQKEVNNQKESSSSNIETKLTDKEIEVVKDKDIQKKVDTPKRVESMDKNVKNQGQGCENESTNVKDKSHTEYSQTVKQNDSIKLLDEIKFPMKMCKIKITRIPDNYEHIILEAKRTEKNTGVVKTQSDIKNESSHSLPASKTTVNAGENEKEVSKVDESKVGDESHLNALDDNKQSKRIEHKKDTSIQYSRKSMRAKALDEGSATSSDIQKNSPLPKKGLKLKESDEKHTKEEVKEPVHNKRKYIRKNVHVEKSSEDEKNEKQCKEDIAYKIHEKQVSSKTIEGIEKSNINTKNTVEETEQTIDTKTVTTESSQSKSTDKTDHRQTPQKMMSRKLVGCRATRSRNLESPNVEEEVVETKEAIDEAIPNKKAAIKIKETKLSSETEDETKQKAVDEKVVHTHGTRKATRHKAEEELTQKMKLVTKEEEEVTKHNDSDVNKKLLVSKESGPNEISEVTEKLQSDTDSNKALKSHVKEDTINSVKAKMSNETVKTNNEKGTLVVKNVSTPPMKVVTKRNYKFQGLLKKSPPAKSSNILNSTKTENKETTNSLKDDKITTTNADKLEINQMKESETPQDVLQEKKLDEKSVEKTKVQPVGSVKDAKTSKNAENLEEKSVHKIKEQPEGKVKETKSSKTSGKVEEKSVDKTKEQPEGEVKETKSSTSGQLEEKSVDKIKEQTDGAVKETKSSKTTDKLEEKSADKTKEHPEATVKETKSSKTAEKLEEKSVDKTKEQPEATVKETKSSKTDGKVEEKPVDKTKEQPDETVKETKTFGTLEEKSVDKTNEQTVAAVKDSKSSKTANVPDSEGDGGRSDDKLVPDTKSTKDNLKNAPLIKGESTIVLTSNKPINDSESPKSKTPNISSSSEQQGKEKFDSTTKEDINLSSGSSKVSLLNKSRSMKKPTVEKRSSASPLSDLSCKKSKVTDSNNSEKPSEDTLKSHPIKTNESNNKESIETINSLEEKSIQDNSNDLPRKNNESKTTKSVEATSSSKENTFDNPETPKQALSENNASTMSHSSENESNIKMKETSQNNAKDVVQKVDTTSQSSRRTESNNKKPSETEQHPTSNAKTSQRFKGAESKCSAVKIFTLNISKEEKEENKKEVTKTRSTETTISVEDTTIEKIEPGGKKIAEKTAEKPTKTDTKNSNSTETLQPSGKTEKSATTSNKSISGTTSTKKLENTKAKEVTRGFQMSKIDVANKAWSSKSVSKYKTRVNLESVNIKHVDKTINVATTKMNTSVPDNETQNSASTRTAVQNKQSKEFIINNIGPSTTSKVDETDSHKTKPSSKIRESAGIDTKTNEKTKITFESFEKSSNPILINNVLLSPEKFKNDETSSKRNLIKETDESKNTAQKLDTSIDSNLSDDKLSNTVSPTRRKTKRPKSEVEMLLESCSDMLRRGGVSKRRRYEQSPAKQLSISSTKTSSEFREPQVPCKSQCPTPVPPAPVSETANGANARITERKKLPTVNKTVHSLKCRKVRVKLNRSIIKKYCKSLEPQTLNATPIVKKTSKKPVVTPRASPGFLTVKSVAQLTMDANSNSNGPDNILPPALSKAQSSTVPDGLPQVASSASKSKALTDEAAVTSKTTATPNTLQLRSTTTRASVLTIPPQNRRPPTNDGTLQQSTSLLNDSSVYSMGSPNISSNLEHREMMLPTVKNTSQTEKQQQQQKRITRFQQHQQAIRETPPSTPQPLIPKPPVICSNQTDSTSAVISSVTTPVEQFTPVEPKKEIEDEASSSANVLSLQTSTSVVTGIPAAIVDNSGTRLYSFLHPVKYNRSHGSVLLDYCCPNLEGPMPAIDPTRDHSQIQSLVRELPAYIVMTTKVVTRADLESKNNSIPASIRKKMEKLTSVQASAANAAGRSSGPAINAIAPASSSPLHPPPALHYPASISALQKQLPPSTKITPKLPTHTMASDILPPLTPFSAMTNPSSLPGPSPSPQVVSEFQRGIMRSNLRRFDTLLKKYSLRISVLTYSERQSVINKILNQATFTLKDVDVATRLLDQYCHMVNNIPITKSHLTTPAITTSTPTAASISVVPHTSVSTITPSSSSNMAAQQLDELHASAVQKLKTASNTQAQRQVPIYDKDRNVIGYQMQVASTKSTNSTRSGIMSTMSSSTKRVSIVPPACGTPASTLKQPAQDSPRIFYTKPLQSSTPIQTTTSSTMETAGRLGRNITIRYIPKSQVQGTPTQNQPTASKLTISPKSRNISKSNVSQSGLNVSTSKTTVSLATPPAATKRQTHLMVTQGKDGHVGPLENSDECILPDDESAATEVREIKREKDDDYVIGAS